MNERQSTELKDLFTALVLAQAEFKVADKNAFNSHFKSNYADLESLIEASRPALTKNGLSIMQPIVHQDGQDFLFTMLCHISGQWMSTKMKLCPLKPDVQSLGAYITYARRYSYAALLGICDGLDDDGEMDMDRTEENDNPLPVSTGNTIRSNKPEELLTENQLKYVSGKIANNKLLLQQVLDEYNIPELSKLPKFKVNDALALIASKQSK